MAELSDWITMGGVVAIFAFLWNAHRDMRRDMADLRKDISGEMADLRERMARLEGLFQGFVGRQDKPPAE
ncbi:MAG: hypothetical protein F4X97_14005 [Boseongicola sp. SB0662_bin_57]|nr:hypothetical protein [Boseongicola sp. SB0662_bin_57]MYF45474.1 hypothetical protein [Paracoccaceae bacterium]